MTLTLSLSSERIRKSFKDRRHRRRPRATGFPESLKIKKCGRDRKEAREGASGTGEMRERIEREKGKNRRYRGGGGGGCVVAAHSGHRTSEGPRPWEHEMPVGRRGPVRGPPGPVLQVDNEGPRRVSRLRRRTENGAETREINRACECVRGRVVRRVQAESRKKGTGSLFLAEVTPPKNVRLHS